MRLTVLLAALVLAPAASAGGTNPAGLQDDQGALYGSTRYVAQKAGTGTMLAVPGTTRSLLLKGSWGIARIDSAASISHDGRTLVLAPTVIRAPTTFTIVDTATLSVRKRITVPGRHTFDALSPDGGLLYTVQYTNTRDIGRYVVRAVNVATGRLLPGRIADKTQNSWIMQGLAVTRVTSDDGRMAYTLYANPGGYPFVHALDTVARTAHCVGVPWRGDQNAPWGMKLALRPDGRLGVTLQSGAPFVAIDVGTWKIDYLR